MTNAFDPGSPIAYAWAGEWLAAFVHARTAFEGDAFVELFTPNGELVPDPFEPPIAGSNAIRAYLGQAAESEADVSLTIERHWVSGSTILAAWHASFVRPDRRHVREAGFLTAEIADGRSRRLRLWTVARDGGG